MSLVSFLHLRKTGGTAVLEALGSSSPVQVCHHDVGIQQLPPGHRILLSVRDPVERAISGFYDRLRRGKPAYDCPWAGDDAKVFQTYPSVSAVADDLGASSEALRVRARWALDTLTHTSCRYWDWLGSPAILGARRSDVVYVMAMSNLSADFGHAMALVGVVGPVIKPVHVAPPEHRPRLDVEQVVLLRAHYTDDYACLRCLVDTLEDEQLSPTLRAWASDGFPTYWEGACVSPS